MAGGALGDVVDVRFHVGALGSSAEDEAVDVGVGAEFEEGGGVADAGPTGPAHVHDGGAVGPILAGDVNVDHLQVGVLEGGTGRLPGAGGLDVVGRLASLDAGGDDAPPFSEVRVRHVGALSDEDLGVPVVQTGTEGLVSLLRVFEVHAALDDGGLGVLTGDGKEAGVERDALAGFGVGVRSARDGLGVHDQDRLGVLGAPLLLVIALFCCGNVDVSDPSRPRGIQCREARRALLAVDGGLRRRFAEVVIRSGQLLVAGEGYAPTAVDLGRQFVREAVSESVQHLHHFVGH
mmetsp:Transcript_4666/g.9857  ORF Transcript_4666/g.9857 Transcript_4666/m.9857 type:complete len:291 (+) Transcript_4666:610-1482(+)